MKNINILISILFIAKMCSGQIVSLDSAKYYSGKIISVQGIVMSIYETQGDKKSVVLNFGKPFPDQIFQAIIFEKDLSKFSYRPKEYLNNKNLIIHGKVKLTNGKPIIMISTPDQITEK